MFDSRWLLQVYEMADLSARESAGSLLNSVPGITVDARSCARGDFITVECADTTQAMAIYELVVLADPHAELIYSATNQSEAQVIRERMAPGADAASRPDGDLLGA